MKRTKHCLIAVMLVVSLLVGIMPVYVNAGDTVATTQEAVPGIENHVNIIPTSNSNIDFNGTQGLLDDSKIKDKIQENTWAFTTTLNLSELGSEGPAVSIVKGTYNGEEYRAYIEIRKTGYVFKYAKGEAWQGGTVLATGSTGVTLEAETNYQLTMKVSDGELLQCWIDEQLVASIALRGRGFTNVVPCFGWRCYSSPGTFTDCKMWEESESVIPTIGNNTNVIPESNEKYSSRDNIRFENSGDPGNIDLSSAIKGNTWAFSTTFKLDGTKENYGPGITMARGKKSDGTQSYLRLTLKQMSYSSHCVLHADPAYNTGSLANNPIAKVENLDKLQANVDYQLTMQICDGELLQCWLNGRLIATIDMKGVGITDVTPFFGWRIAGAGGNFRECKMWEESAIPTIGNNTNVIPESTEKYSSRDNIRFENSEDPGKIDLSSAIKGNTWAFSTTFKLDGTKENYGPGITMARGKKSDGTQSYLRLTLKQMSYSSHCVLHADPAYNTGSLANNPIAKVENLDKLQANVDYQLTMQICDGEILQCWLNGRFIASINLKDLGITDITPFFGWRIAGAGGNFKECKMWEDVQELPIISQSFDAIDGYRTDGKIAPIRSGYVFAGWFTDKECTKSIGEDTNSGQAYAKFVPEKVLTVKYQVKEYVDNSNDKANLCFVTTVDSRKLQNVGFKISSGSVTKTITGQTVYKQIVYKDSGEVRYSDPTVFSSASEWFHTFSLTGIPSSAYTTVFNVTACWTTLDGTVVTGAERPVSVSGSN